ncbi:MAG: hypothetical protein U5Q44_11710 [Dehalococcoidia bacterium]|nr:hypothetical protein [Dehalococcoidia bacterium]
MFVAWCLAIAHDRAGEGGGGEGGDGEQDEEDLPAVGFPVERKGHAASLPSRQVLAGGGNFARARRSHARDRRICRIVESWPASHRPSTCAFTCERGSLRRVYSLVTLAKPA